MTTFSKLMAAVDAGTYTPPAARVVEVEAPAVERFPAIEWYMAILGRYATVATDQQLAHARYIAADESLLGVEVRHVGPSFAELDALLAQQVKSVEAPAANVEAAGHVEAPTVAVPAAPGVYQVEVNGVALVVTVKAKPVRKPRAPRAKAPAVACCSPAGEPESFADALLDAVGPERLDGPPSDPGDGRFGAGLLPAGDLADRPAPRRFRRAALAPLPRPLPAAGVYGLADLADAQGDAYAALGNAVGNLFAKALRELAASIRATGARSVAEYEDRLPVLEAGHVDQIGEVAYTAGYDAAMAGAGPWC